MLSSYHSLFPGLFLICRNYVLYPVFPMKRADDFVYKIRAISAIGTIGTAFFVQNNFFPHDHIPLKEIESLDDSNRSGCENFNTLGFSIAMIAMKCYPLSRYPEGTEGFS